MTTDTDALIARLNGEHTSGLLDRLRGAQKILDAGGRLSTWVAAGVDNEAANWCEQAAAALAEQQKRIAELEAYRDRIDADIVATADRYRRAEAERDDAVSALRTIAEELVNAGFIPGDRTVTLASIRGLISERNRLVSDRDAWKIMSGGKQKIIEALEARVAELEADAERMTWLDGQRKDVTDWNGNPEEQAVLRYCSWHIDAEAMDVRSAIDAARAEKAEARVAELTDALTELVACKDLKDQSDYNLLYAQTTGGVEKGLALNAEYRSRKVIAWQDARAALSKVEPK